MLCMNPRNTTRLGYLDTEAEVLLRSVQQAERSIAKGEKQLEELNQKWSEMQNLKEQLECSEELYQKLAAALYKRNKTARNNWNLVPKCVSK